MNKFNQTEIFKSLDNFFPMRTNVDLLLIYYLFKEFKFNNILELGFYEGLTFSVMHEASNNSTKLTAIDINLSRDLFTSMYSVKNNKRIRLILSDIKDFESNEIYDFINVDGNHFKHVYYDIDKLSAMLHSNGILMIDDYTMGPVDNAIDEFLSKQNDIVPFLVTEQAIFCHHKSHSADNFLDNEMEMLLGMFNTLYNTEYKGHLVKKVNSMPAITKHNKIFKLVCKEYNL